MKMLDILDSKNISITLVTAPDEELGQKIASQLVERRVAACVNLIPGIRSIYRWEAKIEDHPEVLLVIKSTSNSLAKLAAVVSEIHPYDCPEIISLQTDSVGEAYANWVISCVEQGE